MEGFDISVLMGVRYIRLELNTLRRAVGSVLAQTCSNLELLICDDGSATDARAWLDELAKREKRVRLVRPGNCLDLASKLNACFQVAEGRYLARMDDDDYSHPDRLEKQRSFLNTHPEIAFVGCNVNLFRSGQIVGERIFPLFPSVGDFYMVQPFIHPTLMFRREALTAVGVYSEDKHCILCEDYDLLLRLYAKGFRGANLQEVLFDYTIPVTAKGNRKMPHRWNETVTRWRRFRELGVLPKALAYVLKPLAVGLVPEKILRRLREM